MLRLVIDQKWKYRVLRHLVLILSMVLLFSWVAHTRSAEGTSYLQDFLIVLINAIIFFGYAYITIYILIPVFLAKRKYFIFVSFFILLGVLLSTLKFVFSDYLFYQAIAPENSSLSSTISFPALLVNTKDMTFIVALFAIVKYARDHYVLQSNIRELQQKGLEAEIKLLEHQMDPHVIFNNFNNLYSISIYKPDLLECTVKSLKSILHYLFQESKLQKVPLSQEIKMIENYIGLEKLRFGERLNISCTIQGDPQDLKIAPLILYPFVENCFVHGAGEDPRKSWINIELSVKEANLRFYAANSVSQPLERDRDPDKMSANENSIRRLEIQYPNNHRLAIKDRQSEHIVELNLRL